MSPPRWRGAGLAFASGAAFAASTPPIDLTAGIFVGLVGLACALADARDAPVRGFWFGVGANLVALRFVPSVIVRFTPLPFVLGCVALVLLSLAQALPWAAGGAVTRLVRRRIPATPAWLAFAIGIYAAVFVPAVFPWTPAGGLTRWPALLQSAALFGERGTTFLWALVCGLAADVVVHRRRRRRALGSLAAGAAVAATLLAHGILSMRAVEAARARAPRAAVALVSPDFAATDRWDPSRADMMMDRLTTLTKRAEARGAELTIWPESAYPYTLPHGLSQSPIGRRAVLQDGVRGPVLTGIYLKGADHAAYNSAVLATSDGALSRSYDKRHLLWFGETVPLADQFAFLRRAFARGLGLTPGTESVVFEAGKIRAAVLNCYEDTLPQAGREAMETAPNLLVNVTNDAWFAGSAEGALHLRLSILRAIETRRDLVRAVNRGPSAWVSASGEVLASREPRAEAPPSALRAVGRPSGGPQAPSALRAVGRPSGGPQAPSALRAVGRPSGGPQAPSALRAVGRPSGGPQPPLVAHVALLDRRPTPYAAAADAPLLLVLSSLLALGRRRALARRHKTKRAPLRRDGARSEKPAQAS